MAHPDGASVDQAKASNGKAKGASNAKDPLRPRRKKARRACHACQRAHLTCGPSQTSPARRRAVEAADVLTGPAGDERPCQRCIKRGLQDSCQDGQRKKAKYLHDAPNEALMPGIGPAHFHYLNSLRNGQQNLPNPGFVGTPPTDMYGQRNDGQPPFGLYSPTAPANSMAAFLPGNMATAQGFNSSQSPLSARFQANPTQPSSMQELVDAARQSAPPDPIGSLHDPFAAHVFDANDPTQYNFDPASFNFGNHYGALEFGMLGQISSGAAETPPSDSASQLNQNIGTAYATPPTVPAGYGDGAGPRPSYLFGQDPPALGDWRNAAQSNVRQGGGPDAFAMGSMAPDGSGMRPTVDQPGAFAIGAPSVTMASPNAELSPRSMLGGYDDSPTASALARNSVSGSRPGTQDRAGPQPPLSAIVKSIYAHPRRNRDPSTIYESVTQPYSYTSGFHSLIAFLQKRFSSQKTLRIAKALASIRPSFISCTKTLNRDDLIFMEKCFQRTLWEYEDFINACGTPTIVCRRTGEVAAAGKEFSILTGWKKGILLGKEPNLNVNTGGSSGQAGTGSSSSRGGFNTPRNPEAGRVGAEAAEAAGAAGGALQPVFLAELLDDDSVVEFYEDFARLAFGDSRGGITTRCKLLKYKSKADAPPGAEEAAQQLKRQRANRLPGRGEVLGEAGIDELEDKDGKVECSCSWTVKRDLFDLPMM
jgi:hypothetical protein